MDAVHAVEFDLEDVPSAPVGSLLADGLSDNGDFQRVADDEEAASVSRARQRKIEEAHVAGFVDEEPETSPRRLSFQRVNDDEEAFALAQDRGEQLEGGDVGVIVRRHAIVTNRGRQRRVVGLARHREDS